MHNRHLAHMYEYTARKNESWSFSILYLQVIDNERSQ